MKTKIKNIILCPGVDKELNIPFIYDAQINIDENIIVYAGSAKNAPEFKEDKLIDGNGNLAMPGMVNLHTHNPMTLLRSVGGEYGLEDWLHKAIFPRERKLTDESVYYGSMLGIMEMLRFGTTNYCDMYMHQPAQIKAMQAVGMRGTIAHGMVDFDDSCKDFYEGLEFAQKYNGYANGLIKTALAPHSTYLVTEKLLQLTYDNTKKLNTIIHTHISETQTEVATVKEKFGLTPVQVLDKYGLLELPVIAAHCVWLTDDDMQIVSNKNFTVAHNPISNLKLASGVANTAKMLELNIPVALGTDGVASNNNLNLWQEMNAFALLQKGKTLNPQTITPAQALRAATLTGAEALGYTNLGLIKENYIADIIMVDLGTTLAQPALDLENDLIYAIQGSDVIMTMVNGNILYNNGVYANIDKNDVYKQIKYWAKYLEA